MTKRAWAQALVLALAAVVVADTAAFAQRRPGRGRRYVEPTPEEIESLNAPYDGRFHFVRLRYTPWRRGMGCRVQGGGPPWAHDYPRGERHFMKIIDEMTDVHPLVDGSEILALDDPRIFQYPVAYMIEVAAWDPTDEEARNLHDYLLKGGFLIVDDFRFPCALENLRFQMERVLPGAQLMQLDAGHEIFDSFFRIDPAKVIPPYDQGFAPVWYGIFEDNDRSKRLLAVINYNNDISEYWEWSDQGYYPIDLSNEAYKLGVNYIIYGLTH
ncbi:MAG: DUF4159 domain-containing protein [Gemmatimonadota bacterium]|jgi:hypothetical protein